MTTKRETGKTRTKRYREPLPPALWLIFLLVIAWIFVEVCAMGFGYLAGARGPSERKYANAEEKLWTEPMPLLVTYGKKEVEVGHTADVWSRRETGRIPGLTQSGGSYGPLREPTAEEMERAKKLKRTGERITVFFPVEPDAMEVRRWKLGDEENKTELALENGELSLAPGEWVYGVEASWLWKSVPGGGWQGKAYYLFRATGPVK